MATLNPKVRLEGISRQLSGETLFVFDSRNSRYYELNPTAARVYELCDGSRSVHEIAEALNAVAAQEGEAVALATLAQLDRAGLTEAPTPGASAFSRRRFAAAAMAPLVLSVTAHAKPAIGSPQDAGPAPDGGADGTADGNPGAGPDMGIADGGGPKTMDGNNLPGPDMGAFDGNGLTADMNPMPGPDGGNDSGVARPGRSRY